MTFMRNPTSVLLAALKPRTLARRWMQVGRLSMALEIVTRIKVLDSLPVTTEVGRQEAISVLQTFLVEMGFAPEVYEYYDELSRWRNPRFRPAEPPEHEPSANVSADAPSPPGLPSGPSSDA